MTALSIPPANINFSEMEFAFPSNAKLHSINEPQTIFAYLIEEEELIISKSYQIHIIRLKEDKKHKISDKLPSKPNDMKFITIHNTSKSMKKKNKLQYLIVIGYDNGSIHVMDINCNICFTQHISNTIRSISLHFDNCFYSYCPSLILNCQFHLLFITADQIYRTLSTSLRNTLKWNESNDMDSIIATLWSPKKIILTQTPSEMVDIISIPPIDLMKHGIKLSLLDPEPPLNLYTSNQLFLIIIGYQPCITYVQIEKSSKGFGVREIKQGANKLVKSAFNMVANTMSFGGMFSSFWGASTSQTLDSSDEEEENQNVNIRSAAQESIRNLEGTRYKIQCVFRDQHRRVEQIILSPLRHYAALIDSYGRISVLDCKTCCIVRMFKGCRGAQCGWMQFDKSSLHNYPLNTDINVSFNAESNKASKSTSFSLPWTLNNILLLVIYIAPRGILEIYHLSIKHRLGALLFNPNGMLLYHLSLFEQSKYNDGDPSHIFLCNYYNNKCTTASTFSLPRFKAPKLEEIGLDNFDEELEDIRFGGMMYELQINVNQDAIKQQQTLSPNKSIGSTTSSVSRYSPITFIHPITPLKMSTENEYQEQDTDSHSDSNESSDDDDALPSGNMLNEENFDEIFVKYIDKWKLYMADIPNALIQCLNISSESDLHKYWNILLSIQLKDTEISIFCEFLTHSINQIVAHYESIQFKNKEMRLWMFRKGCITSYNLICTAYLNNEEKDQITLSITEWTNFWISHYTQPMNNSLIEYDTNDFEIFSNFLFGVIILESEANDMDCVPYEIPVLVMKSIELPSAVFSLYLELFLFWFVTEQSHKWSWNGPDIDMDNNCDGMKKNDSGRWKQMTKQMKVKVHKSYQQLDPYLYPGYHWKSLLDRDSLSIWLESKRVVSGFGDIEVDWTNERYDDFLSNPLNVTERRYLPTLQYFVNTGAQLLGLLRDYVQNTTQLTHAFLICRVSDHIYNDRSNKKDKSVDDAIDEESDSDSVDPVNNEWIIKASRILKVKIFSYLLDYNHHSENYIAALNTSQTCYMISLKQILKHYYRNGYSLHDIEQDLPISRLLAKYILTQIESCIPNRKKDKSNTDIMVRDYEPKRKQREKEIELQEIYANHTLFIEMLLFMFDVIDYTIRVKSYDYHGIVRYVELQQKQLKIEYLNEEFIENVLINIYYIIRIVPDHINLEWLILYCLFDIYEGIVSQDSISEQLILLHKFQICCDRILQFYGSKNMNVQLQIIILNGQLWYYVLSSLLNNHVLTRDNECQQSMELQRDIIAACVEWIKFVSSIIDSLIVLQEQNKHDLIDSTIINENNEEKKQDNDSNRSTPILSPNRSPMNLPTISNQISALKMSSLKISKSGRREIESFLSTKTEIVQGQKREKAYLYEDKSELASWPPKGTVMTFIYNEYLQPGTLLFFTSRSVIYTAHLKSMLNLYLQILRLHFVAARAKICVIADHRMNNKSNMIYLYDIFPDFVSFDSTLFTFEYIDDNDNMNNVMIKYDGVKAVKLKCVMMIAKKWITGALDLSSSWHLDVNKVKRYIITELCNNYKDEIGLELMKDDNSDKNSKHLLSVSLLHIVKKRLCFHINLLLHSPQHQHLLAGIPADCFQDLLHYNDGFNVNNNKLNEMNQIIKMSISNKDKKEMKQNGNKVLQMNLKLTLSINSLLKDDDFYETNSKQELNTLVQIIHLLINAK